MHAADEHVVALLVQTCQFDVLNPRRCGCVAKLSQAASSSEFHELWRVVVDRIPASYRQIAGCPPRKDTKDTDGCGMFCLGKIRTWAVLMKCMTELMIHPDHEKAARERFLKRDAQLPDLKLLGRWFETGTGRGFTLYETGDAVALTKYGLFWNDPVDMRAFSVVDDSQMISAFKQ